MKLFEHDALASAHNKPRFCHHYVDDNDTFDVIKTVFDEWFTDYINRQNQNNIRCVRERKK